MVLLAGAPTVEAVRCTDFFRFRALSWSHEPPKLQTSRLKALTAALKPPKHETISGVQEGCLGLVGFKFRVQKGCLGFIGFRVQEGCLGFIGFRAQEGDLA